jgi:uncharacterized protein
MDYFYKYIKYKNKFLLLKEEIGTFTEGTCARGTCGGGGGKISDYDYLKDKIRKLEQLLQKENISECHGILHAKAVLINSIHAINAINAINTINAEETKYILYASLLHDADDRKFFPLNTNYENVRSILEDESQETVNKVIELIELVSSSKNGDTIPKKCKDKEWMLIPRYADRLEAIGMIGLVRTFIFTLKKGKDLYLPTTPMPKTVNEIWKIASVKRYKSYSGASESMLDHFYDKLLRLGKFPITNKYLNNESKKRIKPLLDFLLYINNMSVNNLKEEIKKYIKKKAPVLYKEYNLADII